MSQLRRVDASSVRVEPGGSGRLADVAQPTLIAIGGLDPSGGAGLVRDFLTARTWGAAVRLVPTAWTEQSEIGVTAIEPRESRALARALLGSLGRVDQAGVAASAGAGQLSVKIGMLPNLPAIDVLLASLGDFAGPVVFDPVLSASSGGALFDGSPVALLPLCSIATLVTPNADEAAALTGIAVRTLSDAAAAGRVLCERGARAVLVKGGHIEADGRSVDVLVTPGEAREIPAARVPGPSVRGTGCALATAIAVGLGRGRALYAAVIEAKAWLTTALAGAVAVGRERHLS